MSMRRDILAASRAPGVAGEDSRADRLTWLVETRRRSPGTRWPGRLGRCGWQQAGVGDATEEPPGNLRRRTRREVLNLDQLHEAGPAWLPALTNLMTSLIIIAPNSLLA